MEWTVRCKSIHVHQAVGNDYTGDAHALFNMVDGHAMQVEFPAPAPITAQGKASAIANERSSLIDSVADCPNVMTLGAKFLISDLFSFPPKAAYRLRHELEHVSLHGK